MSARIFCKIGPLKGLSAEIQGEATLGRSRIATIRIQADLVSGEHIRIRREEDASHYVLEDLGSTNGTSLDGIRVRGPEHLGHLHVITLADEYDLIFQDLDRCSRRHEELAAKAARRFDQDGVPHEHTAIDENPPILPSFHGESPQSAKKPSPAKSKPRDATRIEPTPPVLPAAIATPTAETESAETDPAETDPAETDPTEPKSDGTQIQQAPVLMPGFLANKAQELPADTDKRTLKLAPVRDNPGPARAEAETVTEESLERLLLEGDPDDPEFGEPGDVAAFAVAVAWPKDNIQYRPLGEGENVVGRGEDCEIRIESPDVSRRHAIITVAGVEITLRDIGSSNRTFIEGSELENNIPAALKHGSRVKFGGVRARIVHSTTRKKP